MIKVENMKAYNIGRAVYSARNPLDSWDKSDSDLENDILGEKDLELAKKLYKAGTEHRKYLRQIFVTMDITAPLYWWKEADTYKIGTVSNSCSTMHRIHAKNLTIDDFSHEHLGGPEMNILQHIISVININRHLFLETKDKLYWWQMIQMLPSSYNQKRTITMNYENVMSIINQRSGHKLDEWNCLIEELRKLPYINDIRGEVE